MLIRRWQDIPFQFDNAAPVRFGSDDAHDRRVLESLRDWKESLGKTPLGGAAQPVDYALISFDGLEEELDGRRMVRRVRLPRTDTQDLEFHGTCLGRAHNGGTEWGMRVEAGAKIWSNLAGGYVIELFGDEDRSTVICQRADEVAAALAAAPKRLAGALIKALRSAAQFDETLAAVNRQTLT